MSINTLRNFIYKYYFLYIVQQSKIQNLQCLIKHK